MTGSPLADVDAVYRREDDDPPEVLSLSELCQNPAMLEPPSVVLPRFAWRGRATLLAAGDKCGKSTLVGQAVAAAQLGYRFLGEPTTEGTTTLWAALDEPLADVVRRFREYDCTDGVYFVETMPTPGQLIELLPDFDVFVLDTVTELAVARNVESMNDALQMGRLLKPYRDVLRATETAGLFLHHARKSDGRARDSSQLTASVDVTIEMDEPEPKSDPTVRRFRCRGRVPVTDFRLRYTRGFYDLDQGDLDIDARVFQIVEANPGINKRAVRDAADARAADVDQAVRRLLNKGAIDNPGGKGNHSAFHVVRACPEPGHAPSGTAAQNEKATR